MPSAIPLRVVMVLMSFCGLLLFPGAGEADPGEAELAEQRALEEEMSAPVVVDGAVLFKARGTSAYPPGKRAQAIADRIVALAADPSFTPEALRIDDSRPDATLVMAGNKVVMSVVDADARLEGVSRRTLASGVIIRIGEAVDAWRKDRAPATLKRNTLIAMGASLVLALALWGGVRLRRRMTRLEDERLRRMVHDVQFQGIRILRAQQLGELLSAALSLGWAAATLTAVYLYLSSVLVLFPWTRGLAGDLIALLLDPLRILGLGLLGALPKLGFLAVIYLVTRYTLKLIHHYFRSIAEGSLVLADFDPDWAIPTYRLVRILLLALALAVVVAYPYIPGSGSEAFKGISLFIGVIFSLGSSSVIGNMIAGYTMTYRRVLKVGDRVMIGTHLGDVDQVRMLVTYLRTPKNELVAIPNSMIISGEVVNYSTLASKQGLILHTPVGIGYETPWRQVEAMLLEAAARTPGLLREPPPFVLHKSLGDFCVTYEINAYSPDPQAMTRLYTELHRNILDIFNEYGVQIMTPTYEGDPDQPKVVPREQWYAAPARNPESAAENS